VSPLSLASSLLMRQDCVRGNIFAKVKLKAWDRCPWASSLLMRQDCVRA